MLNSTFFSAIPYITGMKKSLEEAEREINKRSLKGTAPVVAPDEEKAKDGVVQEDGVRDC